MRHWQKLIPFVVSLGLIGWLLYQVSPRAVFEAAIHLRWGLLASATVAMVLALFLWDGLCLQTVYSTDHVPLSYPKMLRVRGLSYVVSALHCQLGQAMVVWNVARLQNASLITTASRGLLLVFHDGLVLMTVGLIGALYSDSPHAPHIAVFCGSVLGILIGLTVIVALLPTAARTRFQHTRWGAWLGVWTWRRSVRLILLRTAYYTILGVYAMVALRICGIFEHPATVLSAVPLVLLTDSLPSVSGLGTRETALCILLGDHHRETLVAMGLFWSAGMIFTRLTIGLVHLWVYRALLVDMPLPETSGADAAPVTHLRERHEAVEFENRG